MLSDLPRSMHMYVSIFIKLTSPVLKQNKISTPSLRCYGSQSQTQYFPIFCVQFQLKNEENSKDQYLFLGAVN